MSDIGKVNAEEPGRRPRQRLGNRAIGERLRQMYNGVVEESVPDDFFKLLEEAEAKAKADGGGGKGDGDR